MIEKLDQNYYDFPEEIFNKINELIDAHNKQEQEKNKEKPVMYTCPYDSVVGCVMDKGCKNCEIFKDITDKQLFEEMFI